VRVGGGDEWEGERYIERGGSSGRVDLQGSREAVSGAGCLVVWLSGCAVVWWSEGKPKGNGMLGVAAAAVVGGVSCVSGSGTGRRAVGRFGGGEVGR
jgi:hypothetical protein